MEVLNEQLVMLWLQPKAGWLLQPRVALPEGTANNWPQTPTHPEMCLAQLSLPSGSLVRGECIQDAVMELEKNQEYPLLHY